MMFKNDITFTCTGGGRLDLFKKMMLSFWYTCLDVDLITDFICVDDGSSDNDFNTMCKMFPKIKFIKNNTGGQLQSIKLMLDMVKTKYIFHTEDDWYYLIQDNYITKCLKIMESDYRIKNVTLRFWDCMYIKQHNIEYRMHVYSPLDPEKEWDIIKYNDCTYGGLSLNPGLIDTNVLRECIQDISQIDKRSRYFDKEMSQNFWDIGYRRANLNSEYVEHTGAVNSRYKENKK